METDKTTKKRLDALNVFIQATQGSRSEEDALKDLKINLGKFKKRIIQEQVKMKGDLGAYMISKLFEGDLSKAIEKINNKLQSLKSTIEN